VQEKTNFFAGASECVLPRFLAQGQKWRLGQQPIADFFSLIFSFIVANHLALLMTSVIVHDSPALLFLFGVQFLLLAHGEGLYRPETIQAPRQECMILVKVICWSCVLAGVVAWANLQALVALAGAAPLSVMFMLAWRHSRLFVSRPPSSRSSMRNVLIIGAGRSGRKLAAHLRRDHACGRMVTGFLDQTERIGGDIRGRLEDLARIVRTEFVDEIILAPPQPPDIARWVIREAQRNHIDIKIIPDLFGFEPDTLEFEKFGPIPVLTISEERLPAVGLFFKRVIDLVFASGALAIAAPVLALVAIAIKAQSPGHVLYQAQRVGRKGRHFPCYKFRTMSEGADGLKDQLRVRNERQGPFFKIVDDPRITCIGRFLRRYSLDELPQLWNVVLGDMSLVGPRPHPLDDVERYDLEDLQRLDVLPGLTGLWQVTARRDPSFERSVALDVEYIESWSLWGDFRILCRTLSVVLEGNGV